jgi:ring-1,2-phenylacetyl-CoA epoxidase subunit PaaE
MTTRLRDATTEAGPPGGGRHAATFHLLRVAALDFVTDDAIAVTFDVPNDLADEYRFLPGQHLSLRCTIAGDDVRRNYSICSPATSSQLRVGVKRIPGGVFSSFALERLRVGDTLEVLTPTGRFHTPLDPGQARHYGAVAGGSGITPILSILATALEIEPDSRATLIYANRTTRSIMFLDELDDLKNRYLDRFQVLHVLSGEDRQAGLLSGRIDGERFDTLLDTLVPPDVDDWFLCGPLQLTDLVRDRLVARGVDARHVHREVFHVDTQPARAPGSTTRPAAGDARPGGADVTVVLNGRSSSFTVRPGTETILDAALRLRPDAPYACKNGVCGTCRAKVVGGRVEMLQNYALEAEEVERGYVLACQAYPTTDQVTLEFDQ